MIDGQDQEAVGLDTLEGLVYGVLHRMTDSRLGTSRYILGGDVYCSTCGGRRRVSARVNYLPHGIDQTEDEISQLAEMPALFQFNCLQCNSAFTALACYGPQGPELVLIPACPGGLAMQHTPESVAFYLDQAYRAQAIGANSAAVAMFRAALEHLLYEQGYTEGMLGSKIKKLVGDIESDKGPAWARDLDIDYLTVLKQLGDGAIHTNDGDVRKQASLDSDLLTLLQETFHMLLYIVYEIPHEKTSRLEALRSRVLKR